MVLEFQGFREGGAGGPGLLIRSELLRGGGVEGNRDPDYVVVLSVGLGRWGT